MTIFGIDISHHQAGINLQRVKDEGFQFVIARIGQGRGGQYGTIADREWKRHRDEVRRVGLRLCAYWYIGDGISPTENARLCRQWIGYSDIPVALDCETGSGSIAFYRATLDAFKQQGLKVPLSYIPRWYWQQVGGQALAGLPPLWSSRYVSGTGTASELYPGDNSSYWNGYGGNTVAISQFTSSARVAGIARVDANAFKGSLAELDKLLYGTPIPPPPDPPVEEDMQLTDVVGTVDGRTVTVRDVFLDQYRNQTVNAQNFALVLRELTQLGDSLPDEDQRGRFRELMELVYQQHGQASWEDLQSSTWSDLTDTKWGLINSGC